MRKNVAANIRSEAHHVLLFGVLTLTLVLSYYVGCDVSLDLRSVALSRSLLGVIVLIDTCTSRLPMLIQLYSDDGYNSRDTILKHADPQIRDRHNASLYMLIHPSIVPYLFYLVCCASLGMMIGLWVQLSTLICWVHMYALTYRSSLSHQAGDTLLRLLLFWMVFQPPFMSNDEWNYDKNVGNNMHDCSTEGGENINLDDHNGCIHSLYFTHFTLHRDSTASPYISTENIASIGLCIQMSMLYQFPAAFKVTQAWRQGSAIHNTLANYAFAKQTKLTALLLQYKDLTYLLTFATQILEHSAPLFIFVSPLRGWGVLLFIGFHLGLYMTMQLGLFPVVCIAGWIALIPVGVWEAIGEMKGDTVLSLTSHLLEVLSLFSTSSFHSFDYFYSVLYSFDLSTVLCIVQLLAIVLSVHCNLNTLPLASHYKVLEMSDTAYILSRLLGVQQQWFLFDRVTNKSYAYSIMGIDGQGKAYNLHQMMLRDYTDDNNGICNERWNNQMKEKEKDAYQYIYTTDPAAIYRDWYITFGSHRYRKLFQNLANERYKGYRVLYSQFLQSQWSRRFGDNEGVQDTAVNVHDKNRIVKVVMVGHAKHIDDSYYHIGSSNTPMGSDKADYEQIYMQQLWTVNLEDQNEK